MHFEEVGFFFYLCSMDFSDRIFSIQGQEAFEMLAVDLANFQLLHIARFTENFVTSWVVRKLPIMMKFLFYRFHFLSLMLCFQKGYKKIVPCF